MVIMKDKNPRAAPKIPKLSPESVTLAFIVTSCANQNSELLSRFIQSLLTLQDPKDSAKDIEMALVNQIPQAAQMTCILPLAEKLLLDERSARGAVAFIYIVVRMIHQKMGTAELQHGESKDLWKRIWEMARLFPVIEEEWKSAEGLNDLRGWQLAMQEHAREKWKYFIKKQLPRIDDRTNQLVERMRAILSLA